MKRLKTWLTSSTALIAYGFICGWAARGIADAFDMSGWITGTISAVLLVLLVLIQRARDRKAKATPPIPPIMRTIVDTPIFSSPYAPRGRVVVMHPDDIQKLIRDWPRPFQEFGRLSMDHDFATPFLRPVEFRKKRHLEDCPRRKDLTSLCTCGMEGR